MVTRLDTCVATLVAELRAQGVLDNTIILFASDNGYSQYGYLGRPRWTDDPVFHNKGPWHKGKFVCTDGGGRVPFLVSWPGRIASGRTEHLTALYDFLVTAAELAGVESDTPTDGISLVPLLEGRGDAQTCHPYLYWENGTISPHGQSVRMGQWFAFREHPSKPVQLFDVERDVGCTQDVAAAHGDVVERVLAIFREAHVDSEWYTNPGDSKAVVKARRARAEREGTLQVSTRANSRSGGKEEGKGQK